MKMYGLFLYSFFCGEMNDRHLQDGSVKLDLDWDDAKILRKVKERWGKYSGLRISDNSDVILYLEDRRGNPVGELVPEEYISQPWSR